ncbi:Hypothetical predicted protein [Paramuricea clavata]|uniref:Uncharacterized protein n=1 Tax=Paramuricea clavata TaxID=317549 RepID=A0A6S7H102_PARCT|nr:Hypothetical predicted protein [Paramuricea clavata]
MNVQIYSNTKNQEGDVNYNNKFTMTLPEQIDGENKKRFIRALNVSYPLMIDNVDDKMCGIRFSYKIFWNPVLYLALAAKDYVKFETEWMYLPRGYYTIKKMIKELNRFVQEYGMNFVLLPGGRVGLSLGIMPSYFYSYNTADGLTKNTYTVRSPDDFSFEMTKDLKYMLELDQYVLHPDVENIFKDGTTVWTNPTPPTQMQTILTTVLTAKVMGDPINKLWYFIYGKYAPDMTNGKTCMFIYCDEVVPSVVGDVRGPLLAQLQIKRQDDDNMIEAMHTHDLPSVTHELINTQIKNLHIRICDMENKLIQFNGGSVGIECIIE